MQVRPLSRTPYIKTYLAGVMAACRSPKSLVKVRVLGGMPYIINERAIMSVTVKNLGDAFAGESQAHTKYRYFAKIAREEGYEEVAKHFEHTADQELLHAWGHLELLIGKPSTKRCLELAIEGETHEFNYMYPQMEAEARAEGNAEAVAEAQQQAAESKEHAEQFKAVLAKAEKRFAALKRVEQRHAEAYQQVWENL